jgi:hypothetical protein
MLINYINIGRKSEMKFDNLPIETIKMYDPNTGTMQFESSLKHCIFYTEDEIETLKQYHPEAIILPSTTRLDLLNRQLKTYDLDVPNKGFNRTIF